VLYRQLELEHSCHVRTVQQLKNNASKIFSWSPDSAASTDSIKLMNLMKVLQSASQSIRHVYNTCSTVGTFYLAIST